MPYYDYQCSKCKHTFEQKLHMEERHGPEHEPCPDCGGVKTVLLALRAVPFGDPVRLGIRRPDEQFKDVLRDIHSKNAGSTIKDNSRYL
jgi:putative FmdB family regulatory protein